MKENFRYKKEKIDKKHKCVIMKENELKERKKKGKKERKKEGRKEEFLKSVGKDIKI